jgi:hypothetical protein
MVSCALIGNRRYLDRSFPADTNRRRCREMSGSRKRICSFHAATYRRIHLVRFRAGAARLHARPEDMVTAFDSIGEAERIKQTTQMIDERW